MVFFLSKHSFRKHIDYIGRIRGSPKSETEQIELYMDNTDKLLQGRLPYKFYVPLVIHGLDRSSPQRGKVAKSFIQG